MNTRFTNFILTIILTTALGLILTIFYSFFPNRLLKLLGGEVPYGLIQLATYFSLYLVC